MKNGGGHFAPKLGGHFELESGGHFKLELGGQYHWNLHTIITLCKKAATPNARASGSRATFFIASSHHPAIKKTTLRHCLQ